MQEHLIRPGIEFRRGRFLSEAPARYAGVALEDEVLRRAYDALESGDLRTFLQAYRDVAIEPPRRTILTYGVRALVDGRLDDGLLAYNYLGAHPDKEDLLLCAERADAKGDGISAAAARRLAEDASGPDRGSSETALSWLRRVLRGR